MWCVLNSKGYLLPHILATASSLPNNPTITQTKPPMKNISIGRKPAIWLAVIAAISEMIDRKKDRPPMNKRILR